MARKAKDSGSGNFGGGAFLFGIRTFANSIYRAVRTADVERTRTTTRSASLSSRRKAKNMRRS